MEYTLINLTRFGDLLQTQPIIHGLRQQGHEVNLVCLENFAEAAAMLEGLNHCFPLPESQLRTDLQQDWRLGTQELQRWITMHHEGLPEKKILNLSPILSGRLLSRLLSPLYQPSGFSLDEYGFGYNNTAWATYTQAVTLNRGCSPFNLVDSFRCMTALQDIPPVYMLKRPEETLQEQMEQRLAQLAQAHSFDNLRGFIGFQLGASQPRRQWSTVHFAALGQMLWDRAKLLPVLFGSPTEQALATQYLQYGAPGINCIGQTTLAELSAALTRCTLLVSNDTGTMHLAAGLDIPVLGIFLATAQPWDTGPYQAGACTVEPRLSCHPCNFSTQCSQQEHCRTSIAPQPLGEMILHWLETGQWQANTELCIQARVWKSEPDADNFMNLHSLSGDEGAGRTVWIGLQRLFYRQLLDSLDQYSFGCPASQTFPPLPPEEKKLIIRVLRQMADLLLLANEQAKLMRIRSTGQSAQMFLGTCERIKLLLDSTPAFTPLAHLWQAMLNEYSQSLDKLGTFFSQLRDSISYLDSNIK